MLPLGDENPSSRRPLVTWAIIGLNGLAFLLLNLPGERGVGNLPLEAALRFGLLPDAPTPQAFLSCMFVHGGILHLAGNMWFLHIFGDNVEDKLGRVRYAAFYVLCGVAASAAYLAFARPFGDLMARDGAAAAMAWGRTPLVGASGAISGVTGAYLVFFPRARIRVLVWILLPFFLSIPAVVVIGMFFLQDLLLTLTPFAHMVGGVAYAAHVGGSVTGIVVALIAKPLLRRSAGSVWDRETGFAAVVSEGVGMGGVAPGWEPPRILAGAELRDQLSGAVLDGRMDLALDLYAQWTAAPRREFLPPAIELEVAHELLRRQRVEDALEAYRRYLGSHPRAPDAAEAKFRLGLIHARVTGNAARAREWLLQAAAEHPDPATAEYARAELRALDG